MLRRSLAHNVSCGVCHGVIELELQTAEALHGNRNVDIFGEGCGLFVFAFNCCDRGDYAFIFEFLVAPAKLVEEINSRFLHPANVVGVVGKTHAVGFIIVDGVLVFFHVFHLLFLADLCLTIGNDILMLLYMFFW